MSPIQWFVPSLKTWNLKLIAPLLCLLAPAISSAQNLGQVACARPGDYVYLYSSMTTLDVRSTLQCGQEVVITGRYDSYFAVRTAEGETGYVPLASLLLIKTAPGEKIALPPTKAPAREKTPYDEPFEPSDAPSSAPGSASFLVLRDSTPVSMKLEKTLSSANAQVGDEVNFEVSEDVIVDGFLVIPKGATALGVINEAEPKKALGRGGKLGVLIRSVRLADAEQAVLRSGDASKGSGSPAGMVIPVMHGKDITFPKGMAFIGYVNGDTRLKRENFRASKKTTGAAPAPQASSTAHP
ncbi:MAG: SH3 domain-containing protein [Candidatus Acidiferrales bacterium]